MNNPRFQIYSLGCKVSQYDAAVLRRQLLSRGFRIGDKPELVVVNTCSVTHSAISKDRQLIGKLRRRFPAAKLVVMGCWPQTDETIGEAFSDSQIIFWGVGKTAKLVAMLADDFKVKIDGKILESGLEEEQLAATDRSRYFIKVGDGCNQFCSYCLIPFARGRLKSRRSGEIIKEIEMAVRSGYREIVLSGIHLGRYGEDKKGKEKNLVGLLQMILKIKDLGRVRLSSIEVGEVTPPLIALMKKEKRICRHLHISLQSGSDRILKLMGRPYLTKDFQKTVQALRRALPDIAISTDIIVGFPGETEEEFKRTLEFVRRMYFSKIHVFSFSAHAKTRAFRLPDRVKPGDIKRRSELLRKLSTEMEKEYQNFILKKYSKGGLSLVREKGGSPKARFKTEFGFDVYLSERELKKNILV